MQNIKKPTLAALAAMILLSFTNLFGLPAAGASVFVGLIFFFVNKAMEHEPSSENGLSLRSLGKAFKNKSIWIWLALPLVMDALSLTLGRYFVPGYIEHVLSRASSFVSYVNLGKAAGQMAVLALGEEIAWRAFFQKQAAKALPFSAVLVVSSVLFALGHVAGGPAPIVVFDVFFVFVNSLLYGVIFRKTNNAWVSAISHFAANLFSILILVFL